MQPIDFPEANRTFVKPESMTDDECSSLKVCDTGEAFQSCWQPDEGERAAIAAGAPVVLTVVGRAHPPVSLGVAQAAYRCGVSGGPLRAAPGMPAFCATGGGVCTEYQPLLSCAYLRRHRVARDHVSR